MSTHISGLAASIRASTESDTFDLAGQTPSTITSTITDTFTAPFPLSSMIRITFITGAGKLGRQKYDDNAAKSVTTALRELGFSEDRAASCVVECAGTFKLQHDTGKNLKTVVVFPHVSGGGDDATTDDTLSGMMAAVNPFPEGSVEEKIATSPSNIFERMVDSKCPSWSQKKGCMEALQSLKERVASLDNKLLNGQPLNDEEQALYDTVSLDNITTKEALLKKKLADMVSNGILTTREKDTLLSQIQTKLDTLEKELSEAERDKKPKKAAKLTSQKEAATKRKKMLTDISPKQPHKLKHEPDIAKLRAQMRPLLKLEEGAKGRLLTMKETKELGRKEEILEEITHLEEASRGWFESDDAFAARVEACRETMAAKDKQMTKTSKKATSSSSSSSAGFKTARGKSGNAWGATTTYTFGGAPKKKTTAAKTKKGGGGGGVFAQMMMDSDSD